MSPTQAREVMLLVNPTSGRGRALKLSEATEKALRSAGYAPTVTVTESLEEATERAAHASPGTMVASLGGDGFLGAAAGGARQSGAVLLPLAGGRGNDTVRRLGLPVDPVETVASISTLVVRDVDLGLVNGRPYFGVANVGFDGLANQYGNDAKLNLGSFTYLYGGLKALREWKNVTFTVVVDGQESTFPGWFVAVGNVGQYGGGLHICPEAKVDDGLLDVVSLGEASILRVVATFLASFRGGHLQRPGISFVRGKEIRIHANKPLSIFADGEMLGPLPATIAIEQASVRVLVPGNSSVFQ